MFAFICWQDPLVQDDKLTILSQMFWIAVSMLESDFDHEFALAVRLLDKVQRTCYKKLDKYLKYFNKIGRMYRYH